MNSSDQFEKMTKQSVEKLICSLALPTIISMLITTIYNAADTYFAGKINVNAIAAVGIVYSFMSIIQAFGFLYGHGSGNYVSKVLGKQNIKEAENMVGIGIVFSMSSGIIIAVLTFIFAKGIGTILGGNEEVKANMLSYLRMLSFGIPFIMCSLTLNNLFRFQGNALNGMLGIGIGGVLNIILDPVFMFYFNLGIKGAGIATSVSQFFSFLLLIYLNTKCSNVKLKIKGLKYSKKIIKLLYFGGMPNFARQAIAAEAVMLLNNRAMLYGENVIASITVVSRLAMLLGAGMIGFGQGFQPVCGYNYGAKLYDRVKKAFYFTITVSTIFFVILTIICLCITNNIIGLFSEDKCIIEIGAVMLKYQCISLPFMGWIIMSGMFLQNIGKFKQAVIVSAARQGIFYIPFIIILPYIFGIYGIMIVQPAADIGTFLISVPMVLKSLKEMNGV